VNNREAIIVKVSGLVKEIVPSKIMKMSNRKDLMIKQSVSTGKIKRVDVLKTN